jgi:tetratricopeptide (TPR) repeat protein
MRHVRKKAIKISAETTPALSPAARSPVSGKKQAWSKSFTFIFYILYSILIPFIVLGFFEITLRAVGYGYPAGFFKQIEINGKQFLVNNRLFGLRFFPESLLRESEPFAFPRQKPHGLRRIFILGSSAAQGDPEPAYGFSRILDVMLQRCYPDQRFEIINTAITASNSHVAVSISKDCCKADPDLLVLFLGNNEVVGPFGAGTMMTPVQSNINLIRAGIAIQSTRTGQLLAAIQRRISKSGAIPESWGGMEMFLNNLVRSNSMALEKVYANYKKNIVTICRNAADAGAETIICTVPVNLKDSPPFSSLHSENISPSRLSAWDSLYKSGIAMEQANNFDGALQYYRAAGKQDSLFADTHFRLARRLWEQGQFDQAKTCYRHACEQDALRFRATKQINAVIREMGANQGLPVRVVDIERRMDELSPHETPGRELFYDHVHMNFLGNYYTARSLFFTIEQSLRERHGVIKTDTLPSLEQCEKQLVFSLWDAYQISKVMLERFNKPPFSTQLYHTEQIALLKQECFSLEKALTPAALDSIAGVYKTALQRRPDDWRLRFKFCNLLQTRQNYSEAIENYRIISRQMPHFAGAYSNMGAALSLMGFKTQAITQFRAGLAINPRDPTTINSLGVELLKIGRTAEAAQCFKKAIQIYPQYLSAHLNFANLLSEQKRFEEADSHFVRAISLDSNHATAYLNYGLSYLRQKNYQKALRAIEKAAAIDSNSVIAHLTLGDLLANQGDFLAAAHNFERVLALDPTNATAINHLATIKKIGEKLAP